MKKSVFGTMICSILLALTLAGKSPLVVEVSGNSLNVNVISQTSNTR